MAVKNQIYAELKNGNARVVVGDRTLDIARSDDVGGSYLCPVELISASLGS